jgi:hypothetical protein
MLLAARPPARRQPLRAKRRKVADAASIGYQITLASRPRFTARSGVEQGSKDLGVEVGQRL